MITYTFNKRTHVLSSEELEAVERSGRSSWQHYAMVPTPYAERSTPVIPLMESRPGAVAPGLRPAHHFVPRAKHATPVSDLERAFIRKWHLLSNVDLGGILGRGVETVRAQRKAMNLPAHQWWVDQVNSFSLFFEARAWWMNYCSMLGDSTIPVQLPLPHPIEMCEG